ncbi:Ist1-like protein [Thalictrum thalictroides]|uniref:Ist1-like protein n=2 Tax=Thalictrum thalictroides TaxID=46969 RepID=A0A7J6VD79_THATH|nr:Ist1-like protein [Thalictrum thalictroides]
MSLLNQLFSRGLLGAKCKTCLNLAISRIKLLQNKRQLQLNQMRKEIAQFLQTGQESIARIRVEHVIREMNMQAAYDILELFCEFVYARVPILESQSKTCLNLAISRIKLLQNKRQLQLNQMRKEIAQFLQTGQESIARIRVEHVIREMNMQAAYDILELFCEFVYARVPILESQRDCPRELQEAIASIIFAAPRCSDLPELLQVRNLFTSKYGKEFTSAASELRPDSSVNRAIIEKLSIKAPSAEAKLSLLKEIAKEYHLQWDASITEAEFHKKHEDLLDGSNKMRNGAADTRSPATRGSHDLSEASEGHPIIPSNQYQRNQSLESARVSIGNMSLVSPDKAKLSVGSQNEKTKDNAKIETTSCTSDSMEMARIALASAERATAAARRAAELVNVKQ